MVTNYGVSFGLNFPGLVGVSGLLLLVLIWWNIKEKSFGLWLTIIGGGGNMVERLVFGYVRDYWKLPGLNLYNNIYDWLIFVGLIIFLWEKIKKSK